MDYAGKTDVSSENMGGLGEAALDTAEIFYTRSFFSPLFLRKKTRSVFLSKPPSFLNQSCQYLEAKFTHCLKEAVEEDEK